MREIIQKIIATENEAKLIVEGAKAEANRILSEAQKKAHDIVDQARQEALIEAGRIVKAAVEEAEYEKQRRLVQAGAEIESQIRFEPDIKEWAIEGVVRCLCKQP